MKALATFIVVALIAAAAFIYSGTYDIGADAPHWDITFKGLETLRSRSIVERARGIAVPTLDDPALIASGAAHYAEMCVGCHLAPGMDDTEIRKGLYPVPPKLADPWPADPAQQFWVIKHGIKSTAMPAWGATHSDEEIWGLVAFLGKLQGMTPAEYERLTTSHEHHHHHD